MITFSTDHLKDKDFLLLLKYGREEAMKSLNSLPREISGEEFESYTMRSMQHAAKVLEMPWNISRTSKFAFPDIIVEEFYGIEVKVTQKDTWTSTGNSIMETNRNDGVERIYLFFGKMGGTRDIQYRRYEECLHKIAVTHSPRYLINMMLSEGKTIFDEIKTPYDDFRLLKNKATILRQHYRKNLKDGEALWWLEEHEAVTPSIRQWRHLTHKEKESFMINCFVTYPEIVTSNTGKKFESPALMLLTKYHAICSNFRDIFTAGGKQNGLPQIHSKLLMLASKIHNHFTTEGEFLTWLESLPPSLQLLFLERIS